MTCISCGNSNPPPPHLSLASAIRPATSFLLLVLLSLLAMTTLACGRRGGPRESVLTVGLESEPTNLDPRYALDVPSAAVTQVVFNGLVRKDASGHLLPDLASGWEQPNDQTYTFHLRRGVQFHDGRELTAVDIRYTFESLLTATIPSPKREGYSHIRRIDTPDPYTVTFLLRQPFAPFLTTMTLGIMPRPVEGQGGLSPARHPVGTGPFKLVEWQSGQWLRFAPHLSYFEGRPRLDRLVYRIIPDQLVRLLEMEQGGIDLIQNSIPPDALPRLEGKQDLKVVKGPGNNYSYLGFNLQDPLLRDRRVRKAIGHAINRQAIIDHLLKGLAIPASGLLPPGHWAYEAGVAQLTYDPGLARRLLDEAGYPDPDGPGPRLRFSLGFKTSTLDSRRRVAEVIQADLRQVGIGLNLRSYEWGTLFADIQAGNFQLYSLTWVGITDPDIFYYIFHSHSVPPHGANRGRYRNPALDRLLEQGRAELQQQLRRQIYSRVQHLLAVEVPYISLWHTSNVAVMKRSVEGFTLYPDENLSSLKKVYLK